jgi:hypothetical protein
MNEKVITQYRFVETCEYCGKPLPELFRIEKMNRAIEAILVFMDKLITNPGESAEYLKTQYGKPASEAIMELHGNVECPYCKGQTDNPPPSVNKAFNALGQLLAKVEALSDIILKSSR